MSQPEIGADPEHIPPGVAAELLASDRQCRLLAMLHEEGETAVVDLAVGVLAAEEGGVNQRERTRMQAELFEQHLPKLMATGVVEYDSQLGKVQLRDTVLGERATQLLDQ